MYKGFVTIPSDAVISQDEENHIFILNDDGTVSKRIVKLGKSVDSAVQVTENLAEGEKVVYEGMLSLADGVKARDIDDIPVSKTMPESQDEKEMPAITEEGAADSQKAVSDSKMTVKMDGKAKKSSKKAVKK